MWGPGEAEGVEDVLGCWCDPVVGVQGSPGDVDVHPVDRFECLDDFGDGFPRDCLQAVRDGECGHHDGEAGFDLLMGAMEDRCDGGSVRWRIGRAFRSLLPILNDFSTRQSP